MEKLIQLDSAYLVADDSILDKSDGPHIELVTGHWSAKHRTVVEGINLITPLWTDGDISTPVDWGDLQKTHSTIGLVGDLCGLFFTSNLFR